MSRKVYFSFHYKDVIDFRANVVRNSGRFRSKGSIFRDGSIWEEAEEKGVKKIKALIDEELTGSSVTCVLIGTETFSRRFVRYEIVKSFEMGKGQLGVGINWIKDKFGNIKLIPGNNPFNYLKLTVSVDGSTIDFFELKNSDWIPFRDLPTIKNKFFRQQYFGTTTNLSSFYPRYSYDWNDGRINFNRWVETAAKQVGR